jgi:hypothetical protein
MNRKFFSCLVIAFSFSSLISSAQMIDSMMKVYADKFMQEKVYLQFDKKAYSPGDRIWYKAYLFAGLDPSGNSKNIYTELYDADGNLILRNASPVNESTANGSFDLPATFRGTRIRVRAYTVWMLNFDTSFVYTKDLRIISGVEDSIVHPEPTATSLHFFPEGGDLIAGVDNTVAFKAEDGYGQPRNISGSIVDQSGNTVLSFNSTHDGMGKFLLAPEKQDVFYATWKDEKGVLQRTDLPAVKPKGVVLRILNTAKKVVFSLARPADSTGDNQFVVIANMNQQMVYKATVSLKATLMTGGNIPTQDLPSGILQVTVFDMHQRPLAERVCFVNNHEYSFDALIDIGTTSLKPRGRSEFDLLLPNNMKSDVSIAVTDAEVDGNRPGDDNIISHLLLTADLRGYVKNPYYYFQNNSDSLSQQLDLVLLTHGWRRFKWEDLAAGKTPVIKYPVEDFLSLNAEVLGVDYSKIAHDESLIVFLRNKDSTTKILTVPYTRNGKFQTSGLVFYDTVKAFYQFNVNHNLSNEAAVIFKNGLFAGSRKLKTFNNMSLATWWPDDSSLVRKARVVMNQVAKLQGQDRKFQNLDVVTVRVRMKSNKQKLDELYSSGLFSGGNATIFDLIDDPFAVSSVDIYSYLQSRVAGLQIISGPNPSMSWRGSAPDIYVDEFQATPDLVKNLRVSDIAMIKVFSPGSATGLSGGAGGVIAIYTKKGQDRPPDPSIKGLETARIAGYAPVREFYSPDYLINPEPETDDIRTTLYWNPHLRGRKGASKFTIPFYNSDITHSIRIILEGFDEEGKLIHLEKTIQ